MQPTHLDLIQSLWDKEGPLALGWIAAILMGGYIVFLHSRLGKVYKEFNVFTQEASRQLLPILQKATEVMSQTVSTNDEIATNVKTIKERQDTLIAQHDIVIKSFIETKPYWFNEVQTDRRSSPRVVQSLLPDARQETAHD